MKIVMTEFAAGRHFGNPEFGGTKIPCTADLFMSYLVEAPAISKNPTDCLRAAAYSSSGLMSVVEEGDLVDGYAPFCKHLFVGNFVGAEAGVVRITPENHTLLRTGYEARREGELPVLARWFDVCDVDPGPPPFLDIILYSAEQLENEGSEIDGDWGIVSINSAESAEESPMNPVTMMRNALGKSEGGSGVPLDREEYARAVAYWSEYATIKYTNFE